jgi:uncharacterized protein YcfJ
MNKSMVTGIVIGAAVVTAGAAVANFTVFDREAEVTPEGVAAVVTPPLVEATPEVIEEERPTFAEVLDVDAVTKTTRKPRQVCNDHVVTHQAPVQDENRIAGTVIGAVVGGVLGNQVGDGRGKKIATAAGAAAGGYAGNKVQERMQNGNTYTTTETRCETVYDSSEKIIGYDVRYRLGEQEGTVRMDRDPGERIPVDENGELQIAGRTAAARK